MDTSPSESETTLATTSPAVTAPDPAITSPPAKRLKTRSRATASSSSPASSESRRGTGRPRRASHSKPASTKDAASGSGGRAKEPRRGSRASSNQGSKPSGYPAEPSSSALVQSTAEPPNNGMGNSDNTALSPAGSLSDVPSRSPSPVSSLSSTYSPLPEPIEDSAPMSIDSVSRTTNASNDRAGSPSAASGPKLTLSFKAGQMDDLTHRHAKKSASTALADISSSSSLSTLPSEHPSQSSDAKSDTSTDHHSPKNPTGAMRQSSPPPNAARVGNTSPTPTRSPVASPTPPIKDAQDRITSTAASPDLANTPSANNSQHAILEPAPLSQATATLHSAGIPRSPDAKAQLMDVDAMLPSAQVAHSDAGDQTEGKSESEESAHISPSSHHNALKVLSQIEENFARLRERLYEEKASELEEELRLVESNQHPELMDSFQ
ncbi:hypothetical protein H4R34_003747, partial [Dimargaris verticillata]